MRLDECSPEVQDLVRREADRAVREWKERHLRTARIESAVDKLAGSLSKVDLFTIARNEAVKKLAEFLIDSGTTVWEELPDQPLGPDAWVRRFITSVTVVKP